MADLADLAVSKSYYELPEADRESGHDERAHERCERCIGSVEIESEWFIVRSTYSKSGQEQVVFTLQTNKLTVHARDVVTYSYSLFMRGISLVYSREGQKIGRKDKLECRCIK